jgi:hypothetical protein
MFKFNSLRSYSSLTGVILFVVGFCGFAFPNIISLSGGYSLCSLLLGVWGIVISLNKKSQ